MTQTTEERYQAAFTKFMAVDQPTIAQHQEWIDALRSCAEDNTEHRHIYEEIAAAHERIIVFKKQQEAGNDKS